MVYKEIFFCFAIPIIVSIVGILLAYFFKSDPGFIYREFFGAKDFFHGIPKAYNHEIRKYLMDKRDVAFSNLSGEQIKYNLTVEVYEEMIKQIKQETRLLGNFWIIYGFLSFLSIGIGFFMVNNKYREKILEINKEKVLAAYQSRNCLDYFQTVKNNKYFKTWLVNDTLYISTSNSMYNKWTIHSMSKKIKKNIDLNESIVVCPCYKGKFRVYNAITGEKRAYLPVEDLISSN